MSESVVENQTNNSTDTSHTEENDKKDKPVRKSKVRLSLAERAARESQEILKSMGIKDSGDDSGKRRTRSSTKPPVEPAPSPPKRERKTPAPKADKKETPAKGGKGGRGRGRKGSKKDEDEEEENNKDHTNEEKEDSKIDKKETNDNGTKEDEKMDVDEAKPQEEKTEENGQLENDTKENDQESLDKNKEDGEKEATTDMKREDGDNKTTTKEINNATEVAAVESSQPPPAEADKFFPPGAKGRLCGTRKEWCPDCMQIEGIQKRMKQGQNLPDGKIYNVTSYLLSGSSCERVCSPQSKQHFCPKEREVIEKAIRWPRDITSFLADLLWDPKSNSRRTAQTCTCPHK
ncbi:hypothetical protein RUM43_008190 [Polyplax serrata]|uniref:Uncharacterized protein n=1 Tax=Polyplax serrata TaxID=468196 RepID=A0AAN8P6Z9_POLSC